MPITQVKAPDGSIVKVSHPPGATDDEIIAYAQQNYTVTEPDASVSDILKEQGVSTPDSEAEVTNTQYVLDQIQLRYGQTVDLFRRAGDYLAASGMTPTGAVMAVPEERRQALLEEAQVSRSRDIAEKYLGYEGFVPENNFQKFLGVVGAAGTDPINLLSVPVGVSLTTGKTLLQSSKPFALGMLEWLSGTAAETAGTYGAEVASEAWKDTEYEGGVLDHLSRISTSILAGTGAGISVRGAQSVAAGYRAAKTNYGVEADKVTDLLANSHVSAVVDAAIQSQGKTFGDRLAAIERLQNEFPDLVLPLVNKVGDNAIIAKEFRRLYSSRPDFRQRYDEALKKVQKQFDLYREGVFPSPVQKGEQIRGTVLAESTAKAAKARAKLQTKINNIDVVQAKLADKYDAAPLSANVQKATENLIESAEKTARQAANVEYDRAFDYAKSNGIVFPADKVGELWSFAGAQRRQNLFQNYPELYRKIKQYWEPTKSERPSILGPDGKPLTQGVELEFKNVSIQDMDSLKRELNKAIRTERDTTRKASLLDLKQEMQKQIEDVDPEFALLYRNADKRYYDTLGLPTSLEGFKSIDSARFATSVAGALTRPEQIRDYLNFVGDAGREVVRDAFLLKARDSIIQNGEINPGKLRQFVAKNNEALSQVPEVRRMFDNDVMLMDRINRARAKVESTYNTYALEQADGFFKAVNNKNLNAISQEMITSPGNRAKYLEQINSLSAGNRKLALKGVQQGMLDKAMASKTSVFDYIQDNKAAFREVFGEGYVESLENLSALTDIIRSNQDDLVSSSISHLSSTKFKEATGISIEETIGTVRNQILSTSRKLIHLGSKAFVTKSKEKADKALADALLDTKGLDELNERAKTLLNEVNAKSGSQVIGGAMVDFSKSFAKTLGGYIVLGAIRGGRGAASVNDELYYESTMLPTQEEDDWLFSPERDNASP